MLKHAESRFKYGIKKIKYYFSSSASIIGSVLSFLTVLPIISDYFPIITASGYVSGYPARIIINFWGAKETVLGMTVTVDIVNSWTAFGLPPILMFIIYATIGIIGVIFGINSIKKFIPTENTENKPLLGYIGLIIGFIELIFDILIFAGDSRSPDRFGVSSLPSGASIGIGFYLLVISAILIIIGAVFSFSSPVGLSQNYATQPRYQQPEIAKTRYQEPVIAKTRYQEPEVVKPSYQEPIVDQSTYRKPVVEKPIYKQKNLTQQNNKAVLGIAFIFSLLGGILLLFFEFGWWYNYYGYSGVREYDWVGFSFNQPLSVLIILPVALCIFYGTYVSALGFSSNYNHLFTKFLGRALVTTLIAFIIILFGGIVFYASVSGSDEWGLSTGFYGGFIGSGISLFMLFLARRANLNIS